MKLIHLVILLLAVYKVSSLAVMSIDLGSEWMKVALVSPGVPMEIVLNSESQRKTPLTLSFREGERQVGDSAVNIGVRFPEKSFSHFLHLIGKQSNSSSVQLFLKRFPYHKLHQTDNGFVLLHPELLEFTPEELLSQIIFRAKIYAQDASKQLVNDAVITVPPFFGQPERNSVIKAAKLAGIKVLQLINSNTALALNYGVFRRKDFNSTPTNILFYDQGAASTIATIASYQIVKSKERGFVETIPELRIKGVGYDVTLGGFEMQLRLRDHLAKLFSEQSNIKLNDVTSNHRAMAKLLKEAGRLKKVLSANTEHKAQVENVMNDKDLKAIVTRADFEELCNDLFGDRAIKPIELALKSSGMSLAEIDQVIIVGGNTRVPRLQVKLQDYLGMELGKSLNADEAGALGAVYQAAYLFKGFKVLPFNIKDANLYPISVDLWRLNDDGTKKTITRTLFPRNNQVPQKKVLTFNKHATDFDFDVNYGNPRPEDSLSHRIAKVQVTGVQDAISKHSNDETKESKGIKAHFRLDESRLLHLEAVEAVWEQKIEEPVTPSSSDQVVEEISNVVGDALNKFAKFFGRGDEGEAEGENATGTETVNQTEEAKVNQSQVNETSTNETSKNETSNSTQSLNDTATNKTETKIKTIKESLKWTWEQLDGTPQDNEDDFKKSEEKLRKLDIKEAEKLFHAQAKNNLESFIVETRDKLNQEIFDSEEYRDERDKIFEQLKEAAEWLDYESDGAETKVFLDKLKHLKQISFDLFDKVIQALKANEAASEVNGTETNGTQTVNGTETNGAATNGTVNGTEPETQDQAQTKANGTLGLEAEESTKSESSDPSSESSHQEL